MNIAIIILMGIIGIVAIFLLNRRTMKYGIIGTIVIICACVVAVLLYCNIKQIGNAAVVILAIVLTAVLLALVYFLLTLVFGSKSKKMHDSPKIKLHAVAVMKEKTSVPRKIEVDAERDGFSILNASNTTVKPADSGIKPVGDLNESVEITAENEEKETIAVPIEMADEIEYNNYGTPIETADEINDAVYGAPIETADEMQDDVDGTPIEMADEIQVDAAVTPVEMTDEIQVNAAVAPVEMADEMQVDADGTPIEMTDEIQDDANGAPIEMADEIQVDADGAPIEMKNNIEDDTYIESEKAVENSEDDTYIEHQIVVDAEVAEVQPQKVLTQYEIISQKAREIQQQKLYTMAARLFEESVKYADDCDQKKRADMNCAECYLTGKLYEEARKKIYIILNNDSYILTQAERSKWKLVLLSVKDKRNI
ncbi:MAG: hypothetical protein RR716_02850 [Christensenellaceae bacterium]